MTRIVHAIARIRPSNWPPTVPRPSSSGTRPRSVKAPASFSIRGRATMKITIPLAICLPVSHTERIDNSRFTPAIGLTRLKSGLSGWRERIMPLWARCATVLASAHTSRIGVIAMNRRDQRVAEDVDGLALRQDRRRSS